MQFTTRQCGLQHIAGIHGTFGFTGTHHGVHFIDKNDGLSFVLCELFEYGLQAFFKFTAILGTCQQGGHIKRQYAFVFQTLRHFTIDDTLRQTFHDRGLANAGLANQHGIILAPTLQYLNRTANFVIATNDGIQLALSGALGQIKRVLLQ